MPIRSTLLLASAAALGLSTPAMAQDDRYAEAHTEHHTGDHGGHHSEHHGSETTSVDGRYDGNWEGSWEDESTWHGEWRGTYTDEYGQAVEAEYQGVWVGDAHFISDDGHVLRHDGNNWHARHGSGHHGGRYRNAHAPGLGYTTEERNRWLAECRYVMAGDDYYDDGRRRGPDGALIGGLLGAVAGGVAGNRIADDNRLLGTVVGAGLGGLAGAAIGDAIDGDGDSDYYEGMNREELWAARYCEAYLARHEMGAGYGYGYGQPMMMVPVRVSGHGHRARNCRRCEGETVIIEEEIIEVERRPARRAVPAPRPRGDKRTPIN
ncbi:glycine zipper 2TM domain-containing protein [Aurantiacibacter sp. D1-12]|uniref:glycine zipper 2TM domain-containing protein n=1 Tax=Aurantiacibacter sp. D1-12 TaxID=2993658 RepID=UPI00237D2AB2|nr:glycine zipper 2TM domain-containing protein [Aurantiacibacter sp. D1-12]MDE1468141.1 glycine zipper 2TM domain-containing protein [Aurantiacibacter sp. D1-12]